MRVQLTLSTPTTRWNCMFTYPKDLTWNVLKFSKRYLLIADHSFQIFSQRYRLYYWVLTVTLSALFVFVSVCYIFVWLLKLCTVFAFLVRSRNSTPLMKPLSMFTRYWLEECKGAVSVEWWVWKPDWFVAWRMGCLRTLYVIFSNEWSWLLTNKYQIKVREQIWEYNTIQRIILYKMQFRTDCVHSVIVKQRTLNAE